MTLKKILYDKGIKHKKIADMLRIDNSDFSKKLKRNHIYLDEIVAMRINGFLDLKDIDRLTDGSFDDLNVINISASKKYVSCKN